MSEPPSARLILLLGLAKSFKARLTTIHQMRLQLFEASIDHFRTFDSSSDCASLIIIRVDLIFRSIDLDPYDGIAYFHLAQNLALINQVGERVRVIEHLLQVNHFRLKTP